LSATNNPNQMLVEGWDDLFSVIGLMEAHIEWPNGKPNAPVYIHMGNGADEILKDGYLTAYLKSSTVRTFGVMLDADSKPTARYNRIRELCSSLFPALPDELPANGLVVENQTSNRRLGVWIMPDNMSEGCLETFLKYLVPEKSEPVWQHAVTSTKQAKGMGCPCHDGHLVKANLYTWLAWQNPPGQSPGESLTKKILDPKAASAQPFVAWFRRLYKL
jgi:hypothetical protein